VKQTQKPESTLAEPVKTVSENGINVIFKGLDGCNLGCSFCCIGDPGGTTISWEDFSRMAGELEALVVERNMLHMTFTFHGGEPTLLKAKLLDRMCRRIREMPVTVAFNMQSNLISLPASLTAVIVEHRIKVGTSFDPLGVDRVSFNGRSSFPRWLKKFVDFSSRYRPPGSIYVITRSSLGREREVYDICETIGSIIGQRFALQLNPVYSQGKISDQLDVEQPDDLSINAEEYGQFMANIWRLWEENRRSISITPIQSFAHHFLPDKSGRVPHLACTFNGHCPGSHVGIDYNLDVAGCGRRLDSKAFLGSLHEDSLIDILEKNEERVLLTTRAPKLRARECKSCSYFAICHGGCPDDTWLETGDVRNKTPLCAAHKLLFSTMESEIRDRRRPASRPPSVPRNENEVLYILVTDDCERLPDKPGPRSEIWMLPGQNGKWLNYNSQLASVKRTSGSARMRLWCHNRQVKSLMMWEDLLRDKGVAVVLFEAEDLAQAMNTLNSLNALIILDVKSIVKHKNGADSLREAIERFMSDRLWRSQVLPFSQMIKSFNNREPIRLHGDLGLVSGSYRMVQAPYLSLAEGSVAIEIVDRLDTEAKVPVANHFLKRLPCTRCEHYRFCGGRFANGDNRKCEPEIESLVAQVHAGTLKMRNYLDDNGKRKSA